MDFQLTFEEMTGFFPAKQMTFEKIEEDSSMVFSDASTDGRSYAVAKGSQAVVNVIKLIMDQDF